MKKIGSLLSVLLLSISMLCAQVGIGTTNPNSKAKLDVVSSSQGVLFPRMTASQRNAIQTPPAGLMVYQTNGTVGLYHFDGGAWRNLTTGLIPNTIGQATATTSVGVTTSFAGSGATASVDGPVAQAAFIFPWGITSIGSSVYVTDVNVSNLRLIANGNVTTVATGLFNPRGITTDGSNLYTVCADHVVRKITTTAPVTVTVIAGQPGSSGSVDGTADVARFNNPTSIAFDGTDLFVTEAQGRIRKISNGVVSTMSFQSPTGTAISLFNTEGIVADDAGNLFVSDNGSRRIYKITGNVATVYAGATSTVAIDLLGPTAMALDQQGNLYVVENFTRIRKITPSGQNHILAGTVQGAEPDPLGGSFRFIRAITVNGTALLVADTDNHVIKRVTIQ